MPLSQAASDELRGGTVEDTKLLEQPGQLAPRLHAAVIARSGEKKCWGYLQDWLAAPAAAEQIEDAVKELWCAPRPGMKGYEKGSLDESESEGEEEEEEEEEGEGKVEEKAGGSGKGSAQKRGAAGGSKEMRGDGNKRQKKTPDAPNFCFNFKM
eukprot:gene7311-429_t